MKKTEYDAAQVEELLYQALETEIGGVGIYTAAVQCAVNPDLKKEWEAYLQQARQHREVLLGVFESLGLDPATPTPGREVVAHIGAALVQAMRMARQSGAARAAELVAAECVVLAGTKDHMNWELIGHVAATAKGDWTRLLQAAHDEVAEDEDHHLYRTAGWTRELWIDALGMPALLPPPEEVGRVETAIGASRAGQQRERMMQ